MKITSGMNSQNMIEYTIESKIFEKYSNNFVGLVNDHQDILPKGTEAEVIDSTSAKIMFPIPEDSVESRQKSVLVLNKSAVKGIDRVINDFFRLAIQHEKLKTEFIPLSGYAIENLKLDVIEAVKNKRDLCIVKTYDDYLSATKLIDQTRGTGKFVQARIDYGTDEYVDAALLIHSGNLEELSKIWEPKLESTEWC